MYNGCRQEGRSTYSSVGRTQVQEVRGSNPTLGGLWVSPFQVSGGMGTPQSRASGLQSTMQGIPSGPKIHPPSQQKQHCLSASKCPSKVQSSQGLSSFSRLILCKLTGAVSTVADTTLQALPKTTSSTQHFKPWLGNFTSLDFDILLRSFCAVRRLRKSPQYFLVNLQEKYKSPQTLQFSAKHPRKMCRQTSKSWLAKFPKQYTTFRAVAAACATRPPGR